MSTTVSDMLGNILTGFAKKAYQRTLSQLRSSPKQGETILKRTVGAQGPQLSEITKAVDENKFNFNSRESTGGTGVT